MKKLTKSVISFVLAITMTISLGTLTATAIQDERETIRINNYDCYEIDGQFITVIDGEEYIILRSTPENEVKDENLISFLNSQSIYSAEPSYDEDISNGQTYNGSADLSSGNVSSPVFKLATKASPLSMLSLYMGFVFATTIKATVYHYLPIDGKWYSNDVSLTFTLLSQTKKFLADTATREATRAYFKFLKSGSDVTSFNYQVFQ